MAPTRDPHSSPEENGQKAGRGQFPPTRWSLVAAVRDERSAVAQQALAELCQQYWYPIYVYIRRRGNPPHDAEDLTQGFFARLLEKHDFGAADRERGKLRSFLLGSLKHFLADEWDKRNAQKRGGGATIVSIDAEVEDRYRLEPADETSPDLLFEKRWAQTVLGQVLARLQDDYERTGKLAVFNTLKRFLTWNASDGSYGEAAKELGMTENAARVTVFRMRKRYGEVLRGVIADTVADPDEIAGELRYLFSVVGR